VAPHSSQLIVHLTSRVSILDPSITTLNSNWLVFLRPNLAHNSNKGRTGSRSIRRIVRRLLWLRSRWPTNRLRLLPYLRGKQQDQASLSFSKLLSILSLRSQTTVVIRNRRHRSSCWRSVRNSQLRFSLLCAHQGFECPQSFYLKTIT